jgi:hypothetical protein
LQPSVFVQGVSPYAAPARTSAAWHHSKTCCLREPQVETWFSSNHRQRIALPHPRTAWPGLDDCSPGGVVLSHCVLSGSTRHWISATLIKTWTSLCRGCLRRRRRGRGGWRRRRRGCRGRPRRRGCRGRRRRHSPITAGKPRILPCKCCGQSIRRLLGCTANKVVFFRPFAI